MGGRSLLLNPNRTFTFADMIRELSWGGGDIEHGLSGGVHSTCGVWGQRVWMRMCVCVGGGAGVA
jgi:hypothetical protein